MDTLSIWLQVPIIVFASFGFFVALMLTREAINFRWVNFKRDIFNDGHDMGTRGIEAYRREFTKLI